MAVLDLFTDSNSEQNGWSLICDGDELVWDIQIGTLRQDEGSWLTESSCIPKTKSCSFTFVDAGEDGLTGEGFLTFRYGATTLAVAEYGKGIPFSMLSACFGPMCNETPLEVADAEDAEDGLVEAPAEEMQDDDGIFCLDDEKHVAFDILLDENPLETGWSLVCDDDQVFWNVAAGTIADKAGSWITENICVPNSQTCSFILTDTTGDGLSSKGYYALRHGATTVAVSGYGSATPFSEKSFCFGPDCTQLPLEQIQDEPNASNESTITDANDSGNAETSESENVKEDDKDHDVANEEHDVSDSLDVELEIREDERLDKSSIVAILLGGTMGFFCILFACIFLVLRHKKNPQCETIPDIPLQQKTPNDDTDGDSRVDSDTSDSALMYVSYGDYSVDPSMSSEDP